MVQALPCLKKYCISIYHASFIFHIFQIFWEIVNSSNLFHYFSNHNNNFIRKLKDEISLWKCATTIFVTKITYFQNLNYLVGSNYQLFYIRKVSPFHSQTVKSRLKLSPTLWKRLIVVLCQEHFLSSAVDTKMQETICFF